MKFTSHIFPGGDVFLTDEAHLLLLGDDSIVVLQNYIFTFYCFIAYMHIYIYIYIIYIYILYIYIIYIHICNSRNEM